MMPAYHTECLEFKLAFLCTVMKAYVIMMMMMMMMMIYGKRFFDTFEKLGSDLILYE